MDSQRKLEILADAAKYDASCASSGAKRAGNGEGIGSSSGVGICHSYTPDGRCVSLLKILLTNYCTYDCIFCVNRVSSDIQRARFTPEEVIQLTLDFYQRNYIEGLFLSSGIIQSPDYTMEQLIQVARSLRETHRFGGYIHLKTIPGCNELLVAQAGLFADRLSANIEMPTQQDLTQLAPEKKTSLIEITMNQIHQKKVESDHERSKAKAKPPKFAAAGQSTQMIVGATGATDRQILSTSTRLYQSYGLRRVYYTGFSPFPEADSRLPLRATPLIREHRLYQSDWLVRFYQFDASELTSEQSPSLSLTEDPKTSWAKSHPAFYPIDVNTATREALLRIPGIGYRSVSRILSIRRYHKLAVEDLRKLNVRLKLALSYITTADHIPQSENPTETEHGSFGSLRSRKVEATQLDLFAPVSALTGAL